MNPLLYYYAASFSDSRVDRLCDLSRLFDTETRANIRIASVSTYIACIVKTTKIREVQTRDLVSGFEEHGIAYDIARRVLDRFDQAYYSSLYAPNTGIGMIASTSISESATQNVLNAFHYSGTTSGSQCSMSVGLPRILELLSLVKEQKNTNLRFNFARKFSSMTEAYIQAYKLEYRCIGDFVRKHESYTDDKEYKWASIFRDRVCNIVDNRPVKGFIDLHMDVYDLYKHGLTMLDVCHVVYTKYLDVWCMCSPDNIGMITVTVPDASPTYIDFVIKKISEIPISGIYGIENAFVKPDMSIETNGGNLLSTLTCPDIDGTTIYSNNISDIYKVLGVEAARAILIEELEKTFAQSGIIANNQHIDLLADIMTSTGYMKPINRYGMDTDSFISCACFEQSLNILLQAALGNKSDKVRSASSSIMMGNLVYTGTGRNIDTYISPF